jgi:two-component system nitrogen regulation response regulator GlnG
VIAQGDAILVKDLPPEIRDTPGAEGVAPQVAPAVAAALPQPAAAPTLEGAFDFVFEELKAKEGKVLDLVLREIIARAVKADGGNAAAAAKRLGITKAALQKML